MQIETIDVQYLFLPLAHVLGRELEWCTIQMGCETAFSRGTAMIKEDLIAIRPTFMAGVPRIFEKFHAGVKTAMGQGSGLKRKIAAWALRVGAAHSAAVRAGQPGGGFSYWLADKLVFSKLRAKLGLDRASFLVSGGAPLAAEIAEFFHGAGILILEGYGLTETVAAAYLNTRERFRFGTVGPALDIVETKIADDGEILMRGPSVFRQYYNNAAETAESVEPDGWFHSGDIGQLEDGFLRITDRKKDLIVTAGGKKIAPQALENALKARSPLFSQVLVYGDKRPFCVALVTLSDDARKRFGGAEFDVLAASPEVKAALQVEVDGLNATLASYESIKKFAILPADLTEASGDLTPKLSVKRKVVIDKYRPVIEELYRGLAPPASLRVPAPLASLPALAVVLGARASRSDPRGSSRTGRIGSGPALAQRGRRGSRASEPSGRLRERSAAPLGDAQPERRRLESHAERRVRENPARSVRSASSFM